MRTLSLILFFIDAIAALVLYFFFIIGVGDGSVSSVNIGLWLLILTVFTAILVAGWVLRARGRPGLASLIMLPPAIPCVLYGLFVLFMVIAQPSWQ